MTESTWAGAKSIGGSKGLRRRRPNPLRGGGNRLWEGPDQLRRRSWFHRGAGKQLHGRKIQSVPRTDDFGAARINFGDRTDNEVMGVDYKVRRPIHFGAATNQLRRSEIESHGTKEQLGGAGRTGAGLNGRRGCAGSSNAPACGPVRLQAGTAPCGRDKSFLDTHPFCR